MHFAKPAIAKGVIWAQAAWQGTDRSSLSKARIACFSHAFWYIVGHDSMIRKRGVMRSLKAKLILTAVSIIVILAATDLKAGYSIDVEGGVASFGYNDVRIPGNTGTFISLTEDLNVDRSGFWRARLGVDLAQRHRLSLLVAPLRVEASGSLDRELHYNGMTFESGEALKSRYRFDSYRLTYSYALAQSDRLRFDIGFTAKIRDAAIRIESEQRSSEKTNTGFVPLIHFALDWSFNHQFGLMFAGDALAAPQGRAEDILLAPYANVSEWLRIRIGYRILEGGADNDEVYNFTLVHYLSAGVTWSF
jgi:hypothetical protein